MLGVDLVDEDGTDKILGPKKAKGKIVASKSESDSKTDDGEDLPAWQDQPAIPEHYADVDRGDRRSNIPSSGASNSSIRSGDSSRSSSSHASSRYVWLCTMCAVQGVLPWMSFIAMYTRVFLRCFPVLSSF